MSFKKSSSAEATVTVRLWQTRTSDLIRLWNICSQRHFSVFILISLGKTLRIKSHTDDKQQIYKSKELCSFNWCLWMTCTVPEGGDYQCLIFLGFLSISSIYSDPVVERVRTRTGVSDMHRWCDACDNVTHVGWSDLALQSQTWAPWHLVLRLFWAHKTILCSIKKKKSSNK